MPNPSRYALVWLASLIVVLGAIALFDVAVDPYDVIGSPRIAGFNAYKSETATHSRISKAHQIARLNPKTVLLGTSRVDIGLDPDSPVWPESDRPVYDFGIPGLDLYGMYRDLQDAQAAGPLKRAVIVLDFENFISNNPDATSGPADEEARHLVTADLQPNPERFGRTLQDYFLGTLTLAAVRDGIATVASQHGANPLDLTDRGSTTEGAFRRLAAGDGYFDLFTQKEIEYVYRNGVAGRVLAGQPAHGMGLATVRKMIEFCRDRNIEVTFVIPPSHADLLEIFASAGLWNRFETWKRDLAGIVARYRESAPTLRIALWDFSNYDRYSTEEVPRKGDRATAVQWFWEPGHFKKALGELILTRVLGGGDSDFGVELTPATVDGQIEKIRAARQAYREAHRAQVARVADLFGAGAPARRDDP